MKSSANKDSYDPVRIDLATELFFESHGVTIEWIEDVLPKSYEAELMEDLLSLMSSFTAKVYGKRSAENRRKKRRQESEAAE